MIPYSTEKFTSDKFPCLLECLFSAFFDACVLSFDVIIIKDKLCPVVFYHHCFISLRSLLLISWLIRAAVGLT